jgi:ferrochelatase
MSVIKQPYDALLIVSFGGPEGMDDVMPFLENVLRGRKVPPERMREVAKHYELYGGVSPINEQNRRLIEALRLELDENGPQLPIYWGNRNWHPFLTDAIEQMKSDGVKRALAFVTSAYSSYSGCRQYREDIERACATVGDAPAIEKLRVFYNHPAFIESNVENLRSALGQLPVERRQAAEVAFTAHSIPESMAANCEYAHQLAETSRLVAQGAECENYSLVYQSRSGPPTQPWLEPDICAHLRALHQRGVRDAVIAPIGFISDHMEVLYDLDTEARHVADSLGLNMVRASTAGSHPRFIGMIRQLILERIDPAAARLSLGADGPRADECRTDCCVASVEKAEARP